MTGITEPPRRSRTDRLILVLGGLVLVLGGLCAWVFVSSGRFEPTEPDPVERARTQLRMHLGGPVELRYTEAGAGRAICGYAGRRGEPGAVAFVSRPNRVITSVDPLPGEFRDMLKSSCPGFAAHPSGGAS